MEAVAELSAPSLAGAPGEYTWIVAVAGVTCFLTAFAIGANDVANTFSSSVGSRAIPLWAAIGMSAVLETVGATLLGGAVTDSIRSKIIDFEVFRETPSILMTGMLCALVGAGLWLFLANHLGLPVSTTHSIIGALLGFGLASGNVRAVKWTQVAFIVGSWVAAPLAASAAGATIFVCMRRLILRSRQPLRRAKRFLWIFIYLITLTFSVFLVFKNFFELNMSCDQMVAGGRVEHFEPCRISRWADAHSGTALGIAVALSVALTFVISCLVYRFAFYRVESYRRRQKRSSRTEPRDASEEGTGPSHARPGGLLLTPRSCVAKEGERRPGALEDALRLAGEESARIASAESRLQKPPPLECMDTCADSLQINDGRAAAAKPDVGTAAQSPESRFAADPVGSSVPDRSVLAFSRSLAEDAQAAFHASVQHCASPRFSAASRGDSRYPLQRSTSDFSAFLSSPSSSVPPSSPSPSSTPSSPSASPRRPPSRPPVPRTCSPAPVSPSVPRAFASTATHGHPPALSDTDADTPEGPDRRRQSAALAGAKDAEASPLFADPAPHPERRDEVPAAKRERDARRTLLLPPRVTGEAPEGFFAPTVSHDDNGLVFVSQADLADSLGSGVDEEEDAPRSWRGKLKAAWRSMPWFKDIHAEGSTEDDLVARLQTGAEVFDTETELFFSACQVVSACMGCIAHSANDTANAIGPFAAILTVYQSGSADSEIGSPWYILLFGGLSMSLGLALLGYRVIKTVGVKLVKITPARGFSMELGAAWTVLIFSAIGIPLSTTHCAVGSTVGVGLMEPKHPRRETGGGPVAEGEEPKKRAVQCPVINTASVNWKLFGGVFVSWIITIAFSALVTAALFSFAAYSPRMVSK
ncbi:putative phosphate transporter family protein [Toxoplasma gondii GAB2-2007-GAL-DOM2]|uniref:Phosphate transporter n=6 Tax=Toxoplasma gondii TaxID=5811 RepID=S7URZ8_TOXGG|nr:putative phosphate transporter family protein [Toxoplasma gondii GT1]KAF4643431.1 putative phosphate transporter family protein [Toxoplasma gondii]KFG39568.1 putative phosphate transporter family protein [Toxoplasma gondii GAB2-2007-GAL-DOM2]